METPASLIKFIPSVTITTTGPLAEFNTSTTTPDQYQFVLTVADFKLLQFLAGDMGAGSGISELYDWLDVVTCDAEGRETVEPTDGPVAATYCRCRIWHEDLKLVLNGAGLHPSDLNAHLGETQLIPIVHDLIEAYREHVSSLSTGN